MLLMLPTPSLLEAEETLKKECERSKALIK